MLEAAHLLGIEKKSRIYQASTSEMFGLVQEMVTADYEAAQRDALVKEAGYRVYDFNE